MDKLRIVGEFMRFLVSHKKWWLLPIVAVLLLLGGIIVIGQGSVVAPFIYTIF